MHLKIIISLDDAIIDKQIASYITDKFVKVATVCFYIVDSELEANRSGNWTLNICFCCCIGKKAKIFG